MSPADFWPTDNRSPLRSVQIAGRELHPGDAVRVHPRPAAHGRRADIFDAALEGKTAIIAAIEQDLENHVQLAVTIDDDPGRDLGAAGKIGHRFFFHDDEVEPLEEKGNP